VGRAIKDRRERRDAVEQRQDRLGLARDAGFSKVSGISVAAGVLLAYGALALVVGAVGGVVRAAGIDAEAMSESDWRSLGAGIGILSCATLLGAYFLGGYAAGRMARRAGLLHGVLVAGFGLGVLVLAAGIAHLADGTEVIVDRLNAFGAPTAADEWAGIAVAISVAAIAAMLVGGLLGGVRGERWHQRLMDRALDPKFGPEAELSRRQRELEEAERRLERERAEDERRGVLVASRETSGEVPVVANANANADSDANGTPEPEAGEPEPAKELEPQVKRVPASSDSGAAV
jgi:hypothetical protein